MIMMKQTINEQVSRIKNMMGLNESSLNDKDFQDAVDSHNSRGHKILELQKLVEHLFNHGYIKRDEFHDLRVVYERINKRRHDEINNYYTPKENKDLDEAEYDSKGNYMGGTPPHYDQEGDDEVLDVFEPDNFLKEKFGQDINVEVIDVSNDNGYHKGDYYRSVKFILQYNGGQELPEEMYKALENSYTEVEPMDTDNDEGEEIVVYGVTEKEYYAGPEPSN
jgi:hypothetical protein